MAHFAQLDDNNLVKNILVIDNEDIKNDGGVETESLGVSICQRVVDDSTSNWKQCSYNQNMRGNYPGMGWKYLTGVRTLGVASTDVFIEPQPFDSWSVGINTATWYAPVDRPALTSDEVAAGKIYVWNEIAYQTDSNDPKTAGWTLTT